MHRARRNLFLLPQSSLRIPHSAIRNHLIPPSRRGVGVYPYGRRPNSEFKHLCFLPSDPCPLSSAIIIFVKKIKTLKPEPNQSWYRQITQPEIFVDKIGILNLTTGPASATRKIKLSKHDVTYCQLTHYFRAYRYGLSSGTSLF